MNNIEKELQKIYNDSMLEETLNTYLEQMKLQEGDALSGAQGDFYMIDPFAIMYFDTTGNSIHPAVSNYCEQALNYWRANQSKYNHIFFVPPYIRETAQCNRFVRITRNFIKNNPSIPGAKKVLDFYKLEDDPKAKKTDNDFYVKLGKVYQLSLQMKEPNNGAFAPRSWANTSTGMTNKPNVAFAKENASVEWSTHGEAAYKILINIASDLDIKKDRLSSKEKSTFALQYMYELIKYIINNREEVTEIMSDINNKKSNNSGNKSGRKMDKNNYRDKHLDIQPRNKDYWKDTIIGDFDELAKEANGKDENWEKTLKELDSVFDRDTVNADVEKIYNLKHLPKDMLGIEDTDARYDARVYEDPTRKKIKGVSGHDVFKIEKELTRIDDEIADIDEELTNTSEKSPEAKKLLKKRDELLKSKKHISDKLEAAQGEGVDNHRYDLENDVKEKFGNVKLDSGVDKLEGIEPEKVYRFIVTSPDYEQLRRCILLV